MKDEIASQWEDNAIAYADIIGGEGTPHHQDILNPCVEKLMGDVRGKRILDAGCGEGYLSRLYAKKGARVVGIDISSRLIATAKENTNEDLNITYRTDDICSIKTVKAAEFDKVLCNLVLLNIPCFEKALGEFNRVLKPNGELVFSVVHPAFNFYGPGEWELGKKDPDTRRREGIFFKVDDYFNEIAFTRYWRRRNGQKFPAPITFYHRTLSTYFSALSDAGFIVVQLREPLPIRNREFFEREQRIPFFLAIKTVKAPSTRDLS